jgi:hypothetical protein
MRRATDDPSSVTCFVRCGSNRLKSKIRQSIGTCEIRPEFAASAPCHLCRTWSMVADDRTDDVESSCTFWENSRRGSRIVKGMIRLNERSTILLPVGPPEPNGCGKCGIDAPGIYDSASASPTTRPGQISCHDVSQQGGTCSSRQPSPDVRLLLPCRRGSLRFAAKQHSVGLPRAR